MDQYHVSKWAVERHMQRQFDHGAPPEPEGDQPERKRITFPIRRRLGQMLHTLAAMIDPGPAARKAHTS